MPKVFTSEKQKIGEIGENIACKFLVKQGFTILERNYTKKWGEIDIIAQKSVKEEKGSKYSDKLYFIEVKAKSVVKYALDKDNVNRETIDRYQPKDNMHPWKLKRLSRTIQTYLVSHKETDNMEWQFDLICVFLDLEQKKARIKLVEDIIL